MSEATSGDLPRYPTNIKIIHKSPTVDDSIVSSTLTNTLTGVPTPTNHTGDINSNDGGDGDTSSDADSETDDAEFKRKFQERKRQQEYLRQFIDLYYSNIKKY